MTALWRIFYRSARWEWRMIARDPLEKLMLFILPAIAIAIVWEAFSAGQVHDLPIGILDKDNTMLSRKLIQTVDASPNVATAIYYRDAQEMQIDLRKTKVYGALIIPKGFSRNVRQLKPSPVTFIVNAQYGTHSGITQSGVARAVRTFSAGIELRLRKKLGMSHEQALDSLMPIKPNGKMAFNLSLNYQQFLAATAIPALLHILATVVGVGAIGRKLRGKTLGKWFWGISRKELEKTPRITALFVALFGKLFWHTIIFCLWMIATLLLVTWTTHIAVANLVITILIGCLLMILSLWLGVLLTTMAMSKRLGLSNASFITAPAFSFSGVAYPLSAMPPIAQKIALLLPLTYYLRIQIGQLSMHQPWQLALPTLYGFLLAVIIIMVLATVVTLIALKRKHKWGMR